MADSIALVPIVIALISIILGIVLISKKNITYMNGKAYKLDASTNALVELQFDPKKYGKIFLIVGGILIAAMGGMYAYKRYQSKKSKSTFYYF